MSALLLQRARHAGNIVTQFFSTQLSSKAGGILGPGKEEEMQSQKITSESEADVTAAQVSYSWISSLMAWIKNLIPLSEDRSPRLVQVESWTHK